MSKTEQLTIPEAQQALATHADLSIGHMLQDFLKNPEALKNVEVAERMFALYERAEAKSAEREFNAAYVKVQAELPTIVATSIIPNRGKYERFEDVMRVIGPIMNRNGFSVSFSMSNDGTRVTETCHLKHVAGHSQSNSFSVRVGRADSDTQADCKAATTAKRNALLNCWNIVIRQDLLQDEEANIALEGAVISSEECQYLRETVAETGSNEAKFLAMAGVERFEDIRKGSYGVLSRALEQKKRAK